MRGSLQLWGSPSSHQKRGCGGDNQWSPCCVLTSNPQHLLDPSPQPHCPDVERKAQRSKVTHPRSHS